MTDRLKTGCCIVGGGPAGMMLGVLLAQAGIEVTVLEKHGDFLRDFRGDTIHPSTLELMHELGLLDSFLELPHEELTDLAAEIGTDRLRIADFRHLPTRCKFIALMPQWDFLDFLAEHARGYPSFHLLMRTEGTELIEKDGVVTGVRATTSDGEVEIEAELTIAADGRHSAMRAAAGMKVTDFGAPMDVQWFRLSRRPDDPPESFGHVAPNRMMVLINRGDYWQCAYIIRKGTDAAFRAAGIEAFRAGLGEFEPFLAARVGEIKSFDDVKLLTVKVDRLEHWCRPGFLAIGDAAHAMSPIGGVGVNLAVQDAVATANLLHRPLKHHAVTLADLRRVEARRRFPTRVTQAIQLFIQSRLIDAVLATDRPLKAPAVLKLLAAVPMLRRIPAYVVGVGVRPEHIR